MMAEIISQHPLCHGGCELPEECFQSFSSQLERRLRGEPLQYVMGSAAFHCIELVVGSGVLIPRPETEQLVEIALGICATDARVLDLCTGSGAIALAMATKRPQAHFTGVDISEEALGYARLNQKRLGLANVDFLHGDLYSPLPQGQGYSLITANPPYVSEGDYAGLESVVRDYEPKLALLAGADGLAVIRRIAERAGEFLEPGGSILSEIGEEQGRAVQEIFQRAHFRNVRILKDYSEKERFVMACKE